MTLADRDPATIELPVLDLPIIASYRRIYGLRLHRLAYAWQYWCARCHEQRETAIVAVDDTQALVCPACFAYQVNNSEPPRSYL